LFFIKKKNHHFLTAIFNLYFISNITEPNNTKTTKPGLAF
jgi:hypothetical protein